MPTTNQSFSVSISIRLRQAIVSLVPHHISLYFKITIKPNLGRFAPNPVRTLSRFAPIFNFSGSFRPNFFLTGVLNYRQCFVSLFQVFSWKFQDFKGMAHENQLPRIPSLHWIGVMTFSMKISYLTSVQCMTQVSKCYP